MGDANASIPTPAAGADAADVRRRRPARRAPLARRSPRRAPTSPTSAWRRAVVAVQDTRDLRKADMPLNDALPGDQRRAGHVPGLGRRRRDRAGPGGRAAAGPALLAVLMDALMLLLADSRFPAGGYAHSLGLEEAVNHGLRAGDVPAFAAARQRLVAEGDARVAVAARRGEDDVEAEWDARCPSPVLRDVSRRLGSQLLRSAAVVWPDADATRRTPRPVALGESRASPTSTTRPPRCSPSTTTPPPSPRPRSSCCRSTRRHHALARRADAGDGARRPRDRRRSPAARRAARARGGRPRARRAHPPATRGAPLCQLTSAAGRHRRPRRVGQEQPDRRAVRRASRASSASAS